MIDSLPITAISVAIDKQLMNERLPNWNIFNTAWTFITERFDKHIEKKYDAENGVIIVDTSTNMDHDKTKKIVRHLIRGGSSQQPINNIKEEPSFFPSRSQHGIQIADAISYCTLKRLNDCEKFFNYWKIITNKLRKSPITGKTIGYGYKLFPRDL